MVWTVDAFRSGDEGALLMVSDDRLDDRDASEVDEDDGEDDGRDGELGRLVTRNNEAV